MQLAQPAACAAAAYFLYTSFSRQTNKSKSECQLLLEQIGDDNVLEFLNMYCSRFPAQCVQLEKRMLKAVRFYRKHLQASQDKPYGIMCVHQIDAVKKSLTRLQRAAIISGIADDEFVEHAQDLIKCLDNWHYNIALNPSGQF